MLNNLHRNTENIMSKTCEKRTTIENINKETYTSNQETEEISGKHNEKRKLR